MIFYFITLVISFFSRKIFLDCLGAEFMGLTGTVGNLLSFLNMAELGIAGSIGYVLYRPIYDHDREKINDIISVLGYLYRLVGVVILIGGIVLSFFLPFIFADVPINLSVIYFVYYCFLISSLLGYFVNYRYTLFWADQRGYLVSAYFQTANVAKTLVQMSLAYYWGNYYLWAFIELSFGVLYCLILDRQINKYYPWLKTSYRIGRGKKKDYTIIMVKARQLFVHQIAGLGRNQVLPFLVYAYASLSAVAYYANYMLIVDKINAIMKNVMDSTGAGVGNMIAEGDSKKILRVYWELTSLRYYLSGLLVFGLYHLLEPFVFIWLGGEYVMDKTVLIIILLNLFIMQVRGTNDQFIHGYGLFSDTWAPVVTFIVTIAVAVVGGIHWGLPGVLAGNAVSALLIICTWKPYYLFSCGFKLPVFGYWIGIMKYLAILAICWWGIECVLQMIPINPYKGYSEWLGYALVLFVLFLMVYTGVFFICSRGLKDFSFRLMRHIKKQE